MFTQFLSVSYVPDDLKTAIIVPVYKKGPTTNVANYRPIYLTSVASKIMEPVISVQMTSFLLHNNVINTAQHGFLQGLSITSNLLETFNDWTVAIQGQKSKLDHSRIY